MSRLRCRMASAPMGLYSTPRSASGISAMMMSALKMTALRIALVGLCRCMMFSGAMAGNVAINIAGMMAKYFATSLAMLKVVSEPRVMSSCLPISTISMSLVGIAVEIHHVAGFARGLRAGVHRHADVGLGQRRRVVRAVAGHGDEMACRLFLADAFEFVFRRGLRHEIVHAGFGGDGGGGERIVAGDHDGADAHLAQLGEAFLDAAFDHVLQLERRRALRRPSATTSGVPPRTRDFVDGLSDRLRERAARLIPRKLANRHPPRLCGWMVGCRAIGVQIHAAHARLRRERDEVACELVHFAAAQIEFFLRQHHDAAAFRRFVGERRELRGIGQSFRFDVRRGHEMRWPCGCRA